MTGLRLFGWLLIAAGLVTIMVVAVWTDTLNSSAWPLWGAMLALFFGTVCVAKRPREPRG